VNGDEAEFAIIRQSALEHNLFSYCSNNCINNYDETGRLAARIISAIIGGVLSLFIEFIVTAGMYYYKHRTFNGYRVNTWGMVLAFVTGSISGALMVSSLKRGAQAAIGAIIGFITAYIDEATKAKRKNRKIDMTNPLINCVIGFISGLISGNGLGTKFKWTAAKWYVGGKTYYFPPLKIIATKSFAKGLVNLVKSMLFGQINKLL
jgi:hypothetical protein